MLLTQMSGQADPGVFIAYLIGMLIPITVLSVLGASFIRLGARSVVKRSVSFGKSFWITFFSVLAAFITQKVLLGLGRDLPGSIIGGSAALVFFSVSWLLTSGLLRNGVDDDRPLGKALAVTLIQSGCMLIVLAVVVTGIFALVHK